MMHYYYCIPPPGTRGGRQGPTSPHELRIWVTVGSKQATGVSTRAIDAQRYRPQQLAAGSLIPG